MRKTRGLHAPSPWIDIRHDSETTGQLEKAFSQKKFVASEKTSVGVFKDDGHDGSWTVPIIRPDSSILPVLSPADVGSAAVIVKDKDAVIVKDKENAGLLIGKENEEEALQDLESEKSALSALRRREARVDLLDPLDPASTSKGWDDIEDISDGDQPDHTDEVEEKDAHEFDDEIDELDDDESKKHVQWEDQSPEASQRILSSRDRFTAAAQQISDINRSFQSLIESLMDFREEEGVHHPHRSTKHLSRLIQRLQEYEDLVVSKLAQLMCMFHYRSLSEICHRASKDPDELLIKLENISEHLHTAFRALRVDVAGIKKAQVKDDQPKVESVCVRIMQGFPPAKEVLSLALGAIAAGGAVVGTLVGIQTVLPHASLLPALGPVGAIAFGICAAAFLLAIVTKWVVKVRASGKLPRDPSTRMVDEVLHYLRSAVLEVKDKEKLIPFVESFDEGIRRYVEVVRPVVAKSERERKRDRLQRRRRRRQRKNCDAFNSYVAQYLHGQTKGAASQNRVTVLNSKQLQQTTDEIHNSSSASEGRISEKSTQIDIRASFDDSSSRQSGESCKEELEAATQQTDYPF